MATLNRVGMHAPVYLDYKVNTNPASQPFWIVDDYYTVVEVRERHEVAGTDGGGVTIDVKKAGAGVAQAQATSVLASTFNAKSAAATSVTKTISNGGISQTQTVRQLSPGDCLHAVYGGVLTSLAGVVITIVLKRRRYTVNR